LKQGSPVLVVITGQVTSAMKYVVMVLILDSMIVMTVILSMEMGEMILESLN
jgi:hypothetical protein